MCGGPPPEPYEEELREAWENLFRLWIKGWVEANRDGATEKEILEVLNSDRDSVLRDLEIGVQYQIEHTVKAIYEEVVEEITKDITE